MTFWQKVISVGKALSLDCREAARAQSELLDHSLPLPRRIGLRLHLWVCKWCRRYGRQIRFLRAAARERSPQLAEAVPGTLPEAARQRIKQRLRAGD